MTTSLRSGCLVEAILMVGNASRIEQPVVMANGICFRCGSYARDLLLPNLDTSSLTYVTRS